MKMKLRIKLSADTLYKGRIVEITQVDVNKMWFMGDNKQEVWLWNELFEPIDAPINNYSCRCVLTPIDAPEFKPGKYVHVSHGYIIKRLRHPENASYLRFVDKDEHLEWGDLAKAKKYKTKNSAKIDLREDEIIVEVKEE